MFFKSDISLFFFIIYSLQHDFLQHEARSVTRQVFTDSDKTKRNERTRRRKWKTAEAAAQSTRPKNTLQFTPRVRKTVKLTQICSEMLFSDENWSRLVYVFNNRLYRSRFLPFYKIKAQQEVIIQTVRQTKALIPTL